MKTNYFLFALMALACAAHVANDVEDGEVVLGAMRRLDGGVPANSTVSEGAIHVYREADTGKVVVSWTGLFANVTVQPPDVVVQDSDWVTVIAIVAILALLGFALKEGGPMYKSVMGAAS